MTISSNIFKLFSQLRRVYRTKSTHELNLYKFPPKKTGWRTKEECKWVKVAQKTAACCPCPYSEAPTPWLSVYFRAKISRSSLLNCDLGRSKTPWKLGSGNSANPTKICSNLSRKPCPPPDLMAVTRPFGCPAWRESVATRPDLALCRCA